MPTKSVKKPRKRTVATCRKTRASSPRPCSMRRHDHFTLAQDRGAPVRGAAHGRSTSCKASGSVSAITRHNVESDGATRRRVFGSRQAPRARNSS